MSLTSRADHASLQTHRSNDHTQCMSLTEKQCCIYGKTLNVCLPFISRAKQIFEIKGREYWYYTILNWHYSCVGIGWFEFAKIKRCQNDFVREVANFRAAKSKVQQYFIQQVGVGPQTDRNIAIGCVPKPRLVFPAAMPRHNSHASNTEFSPSHFPSSAAAVRH